MSRNAPIAAIVLEQVGKTLEKASRAVQVDSARCVHNEVMIEFAVAQTH